MSWLGVTVVVASAAVACAAYLAVYLRWEREATSGMAYYGRSLAGRRALRRRMAILSSPLRGLLRVVAAIPRAQAMPSFVYDGVCGPPGVSSARIFEEAKRYRPSPQDVFVVTQMRSGTTWMQQLVHQIVTRGEGEFGEGARSHLYAISPWIDGANSVPIAAAPLVGKRPTRIVKSHLPTRLCPYAEDARYIYVARHPASCFASIVDFIGGLTGPLRPPVAVLADWFCSDRMYWLPWPQHVAGWWRWSQARDNVLFVHFEAMTADFAAVRDEVAAFLGVELSTGEKQDIDRKCSFRYMKAHEDHFDMAPPTMFSVAGGAFLPSGKAARFDDAPPAVRARIVDYCREALGASDYPAARFYPDLKLPPPAARVVAPPFAQARA